MKYFTICIAFLIMLFAANLISQNTTFEYLLSTSSDEYFTDIIELEDGTIYFTARLSIVQNPNRISALIAKMDPSGNLIDSLVFKLPDKNIYINHLFHKENGGFEIVASIYDTSDLFKNAGIALYNMTEQLSLYNERIFYFPPDYFLSAIFANRQEDGNILVGGAVKISSSVPHSFIYEFNSDFDSLKARVFNENGNYGIFSKFEKLSSNNYWVIKMLQQRYEILDSSFNIISSQKIPNHLNGNFGLKWDTDTSFYLLGADNSGNNLAFIRQFHPVDTTEHLYSEWRVSDTIDFPALWNGLDFQNKDSIFIGGTRNMWAGYYNPWPSWFVVLQTDSMLNIRWERFYGGDAYYMMGKVVATHDGGCLVAGTRYDYLNTTEQETDIIILKLNSEGLITGLPENAEINMTEAIVYPNPGNEEIKVRIAAQHKQSSFELFDLNGRLVLKENFTGIDGIVNTTFLPSGTYVYKITNTSGLNETGKWIKQ